MKYIFALTALAGFASAHSLVSHFHVNGKGESSCVRQPVNTNPVIGLGSDDMACNVVSEKATSKCTVRAGDIVEFEWRVDPRIPASEYPLKNGERVGVIDDSHMGPCAVYAKKVSDSLTAKGAGDGWFKIQEDGLDSNGVFCTTRLRKANAYQTAKIPSTIEPGDYLLRAEFLTLNNAGALSIGGQEEPQFYPGCVQVTIEGTSGTAKPATVSIPGYVDINTPGLIFDVWSSKTFKDYPMPGPKMFVDSSVLGHSSTITTAITPASATATPYTTTKTSVDTAGWTKVIPTFSIFTYFPSQETQAPSQPDPTASWTKVIPIFSVVTEHPFTPPFLGSIITEELPWTRSGYYATWDPTASSWVYPTTATTTTATTTTDTTLATRTRTKTATSGKSTEKPREGKYRNRKHRQHQGRQGH